MLCAPRLIKQIYLDDDNMATLIKLDEPVQGSVNQFSYQYYRVELHENILFGTPSTAEGAAGLWDVPHNQSVASLVALALRELGWTQFLTDGISSHVVPGSFQLDPFVQLGDGGVEV